MQFEKAYAFVMGKLEKELPAHITYHTAEHTKDVIRATLVFCKITGNMKISPASLQENICLRLITLLKRSKRFVA